jgi:hypothetical protein
MGKWSPSKDTPEAGPNVVVLGRLPISPFSVWTRDIAQIHAFFIS